MNNYIIMTPRRVSLYGLLIAALLTLNSCKKWLDVKPEDKFIEEQLYTNPQGFADAINGIYIKTSSNELYGATLSMTTMDVLAQLYLVNSQNAEYTMSNYAYAEIASQNKIDNIWTNMYKVISNINKFLENLDTYSNVVDKKTLNTYKGEALGLRSFYYFDLMRMFTKPYLSKDSLEKVLPYYEKTDYHVSDFKPNNLIMQLILKDLDVAEQLLKESDPAVLQAIVSKSAFQTGRNSRNYRMNYYAVKALQARVNLWKGDKQAALAAAKKVIESQSKFPWTKYEELSNPDASNKIFGTEMIFGIENSKLPDVFNRIFNPQVIDASLLAPNQTGSFINTTVFEDLLNDYRYQFIWKIDGRPYPTFFKYKNVTPYSFANTVPLIRMAEMYLIAAECQPDQNKAIDDLNEVRRHRNIAPLGYTITQEQLNTNLMKEYRREFYGEGQLFFYYKRTKTSSIVSAATNTPINLTAEKYVFPVPLSETNLR